jgi:hypothetical protein
MGFRKIMFGESFTTTVLLEKGRKCMKELKVSRKKKKYRVVYCLWRIARSCLVRVYFGKQRADW